MRGSLPARGSVFAFLILALSLTACGGDGFDRALGNEQAAGDIILLSLVPDGPVPGNGGIITTAGIASTSVLITWTAATDEKTPQNQLRYKVVYSTSNNIRTVFEAEMNGTLDMDWTANMTRRLVAGLSPGTTYYFNVLVMDGEGKRAAYQPLATATLSSGLVFYSAGRYTGDLLTIPTSTPSSSARYNLDAVCSVNKPSTVTGSNVRAFISVSNTDSITMMPANYAVPTTIPAVGPTGTQFAANWAALMSGSLSTDLNSAGVASNFWWSGYSMPGSSVIASACSGWTDGSNASQGTVGATNRTDIGWLSSNNDNCNNSRHLLCISW